MPEIENFKSDELKLLKKIKKLERKLIKKTLKLRKAREKND